jgi:PadR family transcriptional regulator, regulatory protein AphA
MSLPHALLGLINYQPATGYDLKNTFGKSIHFFWNAALPHIYRTLKLMEGQGWIASTVEHQEGKPSRKIYRVTEPGEKEFLRWLAEPPEMPEPRLPLLVKVFFGNRLSPDQFKNHLMQWRAHYLGLLKRYEEESLPMIRQCSTLPGTSEEAYYWGLTLDFGMRQARMVVDWCDHTLNDMDTVKGKKTDLPRANLLGSIIPSQST